MWWSAVSKEHAGEMDSLPDVFGSEDGQRRRADFKLRVIEHNILVVSRCVLALGNISSINE